MCTKEPGRMISLQDTEKNTLLTGMSTRDSSIRASNMGKACSCGQMAPFTKETGGKER